MLIQLSLEDIGLHAIWGQLLLLHQHHLHGLLLAPKLDRVHRLHVVLSENVINDIILLLQLSGQHLISEARVAHLLLLNIGVIVVSLVHVILRGLSIVDVLIH